MMNQSHSLIQTTKFKFISHIKDNDSDSTENSVNNIVIKKEERVSAGFRLAAQLDLYLTSSVRPISTREKDARLQVDASPLSRQNSDINRFSCTPKLKLQPGALTPLSRIGSQGSLPTTRTTDSTPSSTSSSTPLIQTHRSDVANTSRSTAANSQDRKVTEDTNQDGINDNHVTTGNDDDNNDNDNKNDNDNDNKNDNDNDNNNNDIFVGKDTDKMMTTDSNSTSDVDLHTDEWGSSSAEDQALHYNIGHHSGTSGITLPYGLKHRRLSKHLHHLDFGIEAEIKHKVTSVLSTEDKLLGLPGNLSLSPAHTHTYFGNEGRASFFERSKWAHRQRDNSSLSSKEPVKKLYCAFSNKVGASLNEDIPFMMSNRVGMLTRKDDVSDGPSASGTVNGMSKNNKKTNINSSAGGVIPPISDDIDMDMVVKKQYLKETSNLGSEAMAFNYDPDDVLEAMIDNDSIDDDMDDLSLTSMMLENGEEIAEAPSPRTNFIMNCIKEKKNPMASLIVRKKLSKAMNLSHYGFGNEMAILIAENLSSLPFLQSVNLADNNLSDSGLIPLMKAVVSIPTLLHLDLSLNSFGMDAATLLGSYLESKHCTLEKLRLKSANLDDFKCEKFIPKIVSMRELDLSSNTIGAAENLNTVMPELTTGSEALAILLRTPNCTLTHLDVSWNMIRLDGAIDFASSLSMNHSLMHLDVSYNALGSDGGMALGDALIDNKTLRRLLVATNNLDSVATFVLCAAIIENTRLQSVVLDGNPIGEQGARALMMLPPIIGSRVTISTNNCNISLKTDTPLLDFESLLSDYHIDLTVPQERAVALVLLHLISSHSTYIFASANYNGGGGGGGEALDLQAYWSDEKKLFFDDSQKETEANLREILLACTDIDAAIDLFKSIDEDGSGELDEEEFGDLLHAMGITLDEERLEETFNTYDTDQGGTLGLDEFIVFIRKQSEDIKERLQDLTLQPAYARCSNPRERYVPPRTGTLDLSVVNGFQRKAVYKTLTSTDRENINKLAGAGADRDAAKMTSFGVATTKIRLDEAYSLYATMIGNQGDNKAAKTAVLSTLLPQLGSTVDARLLVAKVFSNDKPDILNFKRMLGSSVRPFLGMYNGFYCLDLSKSLDRLCCMKLIEMSKTRAYFRNLHGAIAGVEGGRTSDLSQNGNENSCFRNEQFLGRPFVLTSKFATPLPKSGTLTFDFSGGDSPLEDDMICTDTRIVKTMVQFFLLAEEDSEKALQKLEYYTFLTKECSRGNAITYYECDWARARAQGDVQASFYDMQTKRLDNIRASLMREILDVDIDGCGVGIRDDYIVYITTIDGTGPVDGGLGSEVDWDREESYCTGSFQKMKRCAKWTKRLKEAKSHMRAVIPVDPELLSPPSSPKSKSKRNSVTTFVPLEEEHQNSEAEVGLGSGLALDEHESQEGELGGGTQVREESGDTNAITVVTDDDYHDGVETSSSTGKEEGVQLREEIQDHGEHALESSDASRVLEEALKAAQEADNDNDDDENKTKTVISTARSEILTAADTDGGNNSIMARFRCLLASSKAPVAVKAAKMVEYLDDTFSRLWIMSRHLALIMELFKKLGSNKRNEFGTYRVDLFCYLFERVVDKHNIDLVLRVLDPFEVGCVTCRIGILSIFNPMRPEGSINLNVVLHEDRLVAKMLVILATEEPGDNMKKSQFGWKRDVNRDGDQAIPGWELTQSWMQNDTMPRNGFFAVDYYSGEGKCLNMCAPNIPLRKAFMQLVLANECDMEREVNSEVTQYNISDEAKDWILNHMDVFEKYLVSV